MFNWFTKKASYQPLKVDIHSHLLAGLDDGVKTLEEASAIIIQFQKLGFQRLITTPHIMSDVYRNTPEIILRSLSVLNDHLKSKNINLQVEAAAEYYLDESLFQMVEKNEPLLTFGEKYLLFETNFITEPFTLKEFIFLASTKGYKLVLAHPERYLYLHENFSKAQDLLDRGVLFQINTSSISGFYSRQVQQVAFKLIDKGMIHWLGSDCHHLPHVALLEKTVAHKYFQKAVNLPLLNNSLWSQ